MTDVKHFGGVLPEGNPKALLTKAQKGDVRALETLLGRERALLYDYLMRMTGQVQRASDTVDEVFMTMSPRVLKDVGDSDQLRSKLINTVRKFSVDIWNADTSLLENAAFPILEKKAEPASDISELSIYETFERAFRVLPGPEREVLWLMWNAGWDSEAIAEATFRKPSEVDTLKNQGVRSLQAFSSKLAFQTVQGLGGLLVPHPFIAQASVRTTELSQVMRGIRTRPEGLVHWSRWILIGVLIIVGLLYTFKPGLFENLFQKISTVFPRGRGFGR
jgi:DNA-directed RNA polymerase specialized sigma24 family protein